MSRTPLRTYPGLLGVNTYFPEIGSSSVTLRQEGSSTGFPVLSFWEAYCFCFSGSGEHTFHFHSKTTTLC